MQRRRRIEADITLLQSLKRRDDDLGVLFEWGRGGEDVTAEHCLDVTSFQFSASVFYQLIWGQHVTSDL